MTAGARYRRLAFSVSLFLIGVGVVVEYSSNYTGQSEVNHSYPDVPLRLGDTYRYAGTEGPFGVQHLQISVEEKATLRSLDGERVDVVPIRFARSSPGYSTVMIAFVASNGSTVAAMRPCLSYSDDGCHDSHELSWLTRGGYPPFLLSDAQHHLLPVLAKRAIPAIEKGKPASVSFSVSRQADGCLAADPDGELASSITDAPYELSLRARFLFCPGVAAPTRVEYRDMTYTLASFSSGTTRSRIHVDLSRADAGAQAEDGVPVRSSPIPPRGEAPVGFFDVHEAFSVALREDDGLPSYLRAHPDAVLLDSAKTSGGGSTSMAGLRRTESSERFLRFGSGDGSAYLVEVRKEETTDPLRGDEVTYEILESKRVPKPFDGPSGDLDVHLPLYDGFRLARTLVEANFTQVEVNATSPLNRAPLDDRYHYRYFFRGPSLSEAVSLSHMVAVDSLSGDPVYMHASREDLARFVADDRFFQRTHR